VLKNSLLTKYLLIIVAAMVILPLSFIAVTLTFYNFYPDTSAADGRLRNGVELERMWHAEARKLDRADAQAIADKLKAIRAAYPEAAVFWVDAQGVTRFRLPEEVAVPDVWSASYTVQFMKSRYDGDPFTTVAFVGSDPAQGFMVFQVPRSFLQNEAEYNELSPFMVFGGTGLILMCFLFLSWVFFYRMRKRLMQLQKAMTTPNETGIPRRIPVANRDEIGQLETAFNDMIEQLQESRQREREEEALRRRLISNLSHDIRTPLTTIRGHAFRLRQEPLSDAGKQSLELIDRKIGYLDRLIDNLLSYTLLAAGKYPYHPQKIDIVRLTRTLFAGWYPVFEEEGYTIDIDLPDHPVYWHTDPQWLERVLDNLLQNVLRHAGKGKYVGIRIEEWEDGKHAMVVADRGPGMGAESAGKGAGIGLSIISLMLKEMRLTWKADSDERGTRIMLWPN
jgi:signal transduction histidine kinase